jgi:membrane associated rhomboid family serine protease
MMSRIPPITQALMIGCVVMFLLQQFLPIDSWLALWPLGSGFMPWQLLTYGFLHGSFAHLLFNLLALYMFGAPLELTWGEKRFGQYFLACVAGAGLIQLLVGWWMTSAGSPPYPTVGASGGIFGLLLAYGMLFPNQRIMLLIPPIPMKARTFVIVYGAIELFMGLGGFQPGVAHFAHLGGMLFGWLMIRYWRGQPPFGGGRGRGRKGPRLVR